MSLNGLFWVFTKFIFNLKLMRAHNFKESSCIPIELYEVKLQRFRGFSAIKLGLDKAFLMVGSEFCALNKFLGRV